MELRTKWTDERLDDRFDQIDRRFDRLEAHMDSRFDRLDARFDRLQVALIVTLASLLTAFAAARF